MKALPPQVLEAAGMAVRNRLSRDAMRLASASDDLIERLQRGALDFRRTPSVVARSGAFDAAEADTLRSALGLSLAEYLTTLRLEIAAAILPRTAAPIGRLALGLGFPSPSYFGRIFKAAYGTTPAAYRRSEVSGAGSTERRESAVDGRLLTPEHWRSWLLGTLPREESQAVFRELREQLTQSAEGRAAIEQSIADHLAELVRRRPELQDKVIRNVGRCFTTPALFERLLTLSRELDHHDQQLGVKVAEEAIASLGSLRGQLSTPDLIDLEQRGRSRVGRARRSARDTLTRN